MDEVNKSLPGRVSVVIKRGLRRANPVVQPRWELVLHVAEGPRRARLTGKIWMTKDEGGLCRLLDGHGALFQSNFRSGFRWGFKLQEAVSLSRLTGIVTGTEVGQKRTQAESYNKVRTVLRSSTIWSYSWLRLVRGGGRQVGHPNNPSLPRPCPFPLVPAPPLSRSLWGRHPTRTQTNKHSSAGQSRNSLRM